MNKFTFEQTLRHGTPPKLNINAPEPKDVFRLIKASLRLIRKSQKKLGLTNKNPTVKFDSSKTPTDVFKRVIQVNRQLNLMLDYRFSPSDVYQKVVEATNRAEKILEYLSTN